MPPLTSAQIIHCVVLMRNLSSMQDACDAAGVRLRSHMQRAWGTVHSILLPLDTATPLACAADSDAQTLRLNSAAAGACVPLGCMVDVDINMHRSGVTP